MPHESEWDTPDGREPPDYKVANVALWLTRCSDLARLCRVDFEVFERISLIAEEINEAIGTRGARVGEIVEALRKVRPKGSILADLPTIRAKPPMPRDPHE